jgi:hypothetical protein
MQRVVGRKLPASIIAKRETLDYVLPVDFI